MIKLPGQTRQWVQANNSDLYGNISVTKNINFDEEGYLKLANSPRLSMDASVDADFDNPAVILFSEDYGYFIETWDKAFSADETILASYPTEIATAGVPSGDIQSDAVWFGGLMVVTQNTDVDYYDPSANTWTDTNISLTNTSQSQHPCVNFLSLSALAIADVNTVKLYSSPITATPTLVTTLTILADFYITGMCYFNQNLYIATRNNYGGHAYLYVWNGTGTSAQSAYEVDSNIIFSTCVFQDSVVILTGNGSLLRFNGSGFTMLDAFPIFYTDRALTDEDNIKMYKNIMKSNGDLLYILFSDNFSNQHLLNQPDGIWCYDEKVGLYHRYSLSKSLVVPDAVSTSDVNTSTNQITVTAAPVTGTEVYYRANGGTAIGGLTDEQKYFVIKVDSTHVKLALSKTDALAGTAIDLTGTGDIGQDLIFFPNTDFGQTIVDRGMSLCVIERPVTDTQYGTDVLWGGEVPSRDNSSTNDESFGTVSSGVEARGYFITPKVFSSEVTDQFNKFVLKFAPFNSDIDKIIVKYRVSDDNKTIINLNGAVWEATWTSSTTFTSTQTTLEDAEVGDEIEILSGAAGGLLAHITDISENAGTYTITIDETFYDYASGDKSDFVFRNWKKLTTVSYGDTEASNGYVEKQIGDRGKFIQMKIELRGVGIKIEELTIDNIYKLPSSR